jgi:hypothetical protein
VKTEKEIKCKGNGITLTSKAKYYDKWTRTSCNLYKYTTPNPPKIVVDVH